MIWPWQVSGPLGKCPCGAEEATRICSIVGWRLEAGRVRTVELGARFSCQRCARIYSVGPAGVFEHHADALPITLTHARALPSASPKAPPPETRPRRREPELIPKPRPET